MRKHLDRETINRWIEQADPGIRQIMLAEDDTMSCGASHHGDGVCIIGPATAELVVYRDGGWSARALPSITPDQIRASAR